MDIAFPKAGDGQDRFVISVVMPLGVCYEYGSGKTTVNLPP